MKWTGFTAVLALIAALTGAASAQSQGLNGCWNYAAGDVYSTVCFNGEGSGSFNLDWATADPDQGLIKGSCNGDLTVEAVDDSQVSFTVPYQENACRIEADIMRMSQRDYSCARSGNELICSLIVYYDDGTIFQQAAGLRYSR